VFRAEKPPRLGSGHPPARLSMGLAPAPDNNAASVVGAEVDYLSLIGVEPVEFPHRFVQGGQVGTRVAVPVLEGPRFVRP
jgi:hypothetical protein